MTDAPADLIPVVVDATPLISAVQARHPAPGDILAFDADGTIWAGDVAEDLLEAALHAAWIREAARPGLTALLARHGLPTDGTPTALAARVDEAFRAGQVDELPAYEMMAWVYAGHTEAELVALATEALAARGLPSRVRPAVPVVQRWARDAGLRVLVVSASPVQVVAAGLALCGLAVDGLVGAQTAVVEGRLAPRMAEPVPYGPQKVVAARARVGDARWLASFGDSGFDFELLAAAELAVAVDPKPGLARRLGELPGQVLRYQP